MCGIVGVLGTQPAAPVILDALKRLEYRGYDSAGIATLVNGEIDRRRAVGKLTALDAVLTASPLDGTAGIGHTRWATHGPASEKNAHPHITDKVALVHNGIIENFRELRAELEADGVTFTSDTDTEIVAHLITQAMKAGASAIDAASQTLSRLEGAFALCILFRGEEDLMIGARKGSPLAIGYGDGEMYLGSDAFALAPMTNQVAFLEEGDWAIVKRGGVTVYDADGKKSRPSGENHRCECSTCRQGQPPAFHGKGNLRTARSDRPYADRIYRHDGQPSGAAFPACRFFNTE